TSSRHRVPDPERFDADRIARRAFLRRRRVGGGDERVALEAVVDLAATADVARVHRVLDDLGFDAARGDLAVRAHHALGRAADRALADRLAAGEGHRAGEGLLQGRAV